MLLEILFGLNKWGGVNSDVSNSITIDASGNIYITGVFQDTADFDPDVTTFNLISNGVEDVFICKLDALGNLLWAKQFGGIGWDEGISITTDLNGNIYTTGWFFGTVDFDPGLGIYNLTSVGGYDIFICKLDSFGNFVWAKQMGGTGHEYPQSIHIDANDNIYTTGYFSNTVDFDPGSSNFNLTAVGLEDIFISKLDTSGNFAWAKQIGGTSFDAGKSITTDLNGNVYSTGYFNGTVDFDPGISSFNLTSSLGSDIFISKLDASGNFVWAKQMSGTGSDISYSIISDPSGYIYSCGRFKDTVDFNPGTGTFNLVSVGEYDIFLSKLDTSGNFVWAKQMGGILTEESYSITTDGYGNIYSTGYFENTVDFNPDSNTYNLTSVGAYDIFVHKIGQAPTFIIENDNNNNMLKVYPNPTSGIFNVFINSNEKIIALNIFDALGRLVLSSDYNNEYKIEIDLKAKEGLYFIEAITSNYQKITTKVLKQ